MNNQHSDMSIEEAAHIATFHITDPAKRATLKQDLVDKLRNDEAVSQKSQSSIHDK